MAVALLLVLMASTAFAKVPTAGSVNAPVGSVSSITPTVSADVMPSAITEFGTHEITYTFSLHNNYTNTITPTLAFTVTLDSYPWLSYISSEPTDTLLLPEEKSVVFTPTLAYCEPVTITLVAEAQFNDQGSLGSAYLPERGLVTMWELNDDGTIISDTLETKVLLYSKIYLPLVVRNF